MNKYCLLVLMTASAQAFAQSSIGLDPTQTQPAQGGGVHFGQGTGTPAVGSPAAAASGGGGGTASAPAPKKTPAAAASHAATGGTAAANTNTSTNSNANTNTSSSGSNSTSTPAPVWPNCGPQFSPAPANVANGTPCDQVFPPAESPTFAGMFPAWSAYADAHHITPVNADHCQSEPAGMWACWLPDQIATYGNCVGQSLGGVVVFGSSINGYFVNLAAGMSPDTYLNNPYAIGRQLCDSYCQANPGRSGCQNYNQNTGGVSQNAPTVVLLGPPADSTANGVPKNDFRLDEPIEMIATINNTAGDIRITGCAEPAGGSGCNANPSAFQNLTDGGFTCNYPGGHFSCRRVRSAAQDGFPTGSYDVYFRNGITNATTKVSYTIH